MSGLAAFGSGRSIRRCLPSCQLPILNPARVTGGGGESPFVVFLVFRVITVKEQDLAVSLKGQDVRADAVQKPAVVADYDDASGKALQRVFQRAQCVDIQIVGRLVK